MLLEMNISMKLEKYGVNVTKNVSQKKLTKNVQRNLMPKTASTLHVRKLRC